MVVIIPNNFGIYDVLYVGEYILSVDELVG